MCMHRLLVVPVVPELALRDSGISEDACLFLLELLIQVQSVTYLVVRRGGRRATQLRNPLKANSWSETTVYNNKKQHLYNMV